MAKKVSVWERPPRKKRPDVHMPKNKSKRANYKKYVGQGR